LFDEPIASIAATVLAGTGEIERLKGERLDSSQPAKSPLAATTTGKATNRIGEDLLSIERAPADPVGAEIADQPTPASLSKGYRNLELIATILGLGSWPKKVPMGANPWTAGDFQAADGRGAQDGHMCYMCRRP
ncbi:MAG: hypothetical protein L0Y50_05945, partial [Beijerinckiaceae bacterium]|nr:hypothetical protein [Beijerinckiaceae bacterium]